MSTATRMIPKARVPRGAATPYASRIVIHSTSGRPLQDPRRCQSSAVDSGRQPKGLGDRRTARMGVPALRGSRLATRTQTEPRPRANREGRVGWGERHSIAVRRLPAVRVAVLVRAHVHHHRVGIPSVASASAVVVLGILGIAACGRAKTRPDGTAGPVGRVRASRVVPLR